MQLVESHIIKPTDPRYSKIDVACFASKNLYNAALYEVRQAFIFQGVYLNYNEMDKRMQSHEAYKALPAKVAQQVLKLLDKNWQSFFAAIAEWRDHPERFLGRPKLPKYKDKVKGRNILIYTAQAVSKKALKKGLVKPSQLNIEVVSICPEVDQVRIVPRNGFYVVEVVYEQDGEQEPVKADLYAGIDLGINNLATITSNKDGFVPRLVNGRPVKSINQFYNKRRAELQSKLAQEDAKRHTSKRLERITNKRTRKIDHYLHTASRRIIDLLVSEGIGTLVIGYNQEWKQEVNIGKRNNQNFVNIPFARFIHLLTYKAELVGIQVRMTEESYTSKCSFLDSEPIGKMAQQPCRSVPTVLSVPELFLREGKRFLAPSVQHLSRLGGSRSPDPLQQVKRAENPFSHPSRLPSPEKGNVTRNRTHSMLWIDIFLLRETHTKATGENVRSLAGQERKEKKSDPWV